MSGPGQAQIATSTRPNRYPAIFKAAAELAAALDVDVRPVLSYGCSTGHEALSLADYFPASRILGVDVSSEALAEARANTADHPRVTVAISEPGVILETAPFGAIFAMSVLCRWPQTRAMTDISEVFPFADFERHARLLDDALAPGGVLVLFNSSYSFRDTAVAAGYDLVLSPMLNERTLLLGDQVRRFGRDGVYRGGSVPWDCVYVKRTDPPEPGLVTIRGGDGKVLGKVAG